MKHVHNHSIHIHSTIYLHNSTHKQQGLTYLPENLSLSNFMFGKKRSKHIVKDIFPAHRKIYFQQLLKVKIYLVSQAELAFICSNSATLTVK